MSSSPTLPQPRRLVSLDWLSGVIGAALLVLMLRNAIEHVPLYDELLHVLSARGFLQTGQPAIADGTYLRASVFTRLVAWSMGTFGDTLAAARLPALLAGAALVFVTCFWVGRCAGRAAGWFAGLALCMLPATQQLSVFARFYTLHALTILVMGMLIYQAAAMWHRRWLLALPLAGFFFLLPLAWHLQESTAIAVGALLSGALAVLCHDHWTGLSAVIRKRPLVTVLAVFIGAGLGIATLVFSGLPAQLASAPLWAVGNSTRPQYYLEALASDLPLLWPLFPVAILVAIRSHTRFTWFCGTVVVAGIAVHSLAGAKSMRYVFYLMPFFAAVWACAMVETLDCLRRFDVQQKRRSWLIWLMLPVLALSQEGERILKLLAGKTLAAAEMGYVGEPDWGQIEPSLREAARTAGKLVTSNAMKALYYFGRYDYELNASIVAETDSGQEFGIDQRTGRPAISSGASVAKVLTGRDIALVILEQEKIGVASGVPVGAMAELEKRCAELQVAVHLEVRAWRCTPPATP